MNQLFKTDLIDSSPLIPASFPIGRAWFVCYTEIAKEAKAAKEIAQAGFGVFAPIATRLIMRKGKKRELCEPVFPRYIFVEFDRELDDWGQIQNLNGVQFIIRNNMMPVKVPNIVIDRLKRADEAGVFTPQSALFENDDVEIQEGPFRDLIGKVKSASPRKRVKVLLNILGRDTAVDIDPCFLKKLR